MKLLGATLLVAALSLSALAQDKPGSIPVKARSARTAVFVNAKNKGPKKPKGHANPGRPNSRPKVQKPKNRASKRLAPN